MRRILALSRADQLRALVDLRRYLGLQAPEHEDIDHRLERKAEALEVLRQVVAHLGRKPKASEFDHLLKELRLDDAWSKSKIIALFRKWNYAFEALDGAPPQTPEEAALRSALRGRKRGLEDYMTAIRRWLDTDPPKLTLRAYDAWAKRTNAAGLRDEAPLPHGQTIVNGLVHPWRDVLRVAHGEISIEDAAIKSASPMADYSTGPDDLIGGITAAQIIGTGRSNITHLRRKKSFPPPALRLRGDRPVWVREDIEAYANGQRGGWKRRGLQARYYNSAEMAELVQLERSQLSEPRVAAPRPTGRASGAIYWLKSDADRWIQEHREVIERRRAKRRRL